MLPSKLYAESLGDLTASRAAMLDPVWIESLQTQSGATRLQASMNLIQVQQAITALSNAALSDIADKMTAQEDEIQIATDNLNGALEDLTKVQAVLNAVTSVLNIVASIVKLV